MYYFFQVLFKVSFKFIIWLELSLFRSFRRSYIYYNKIKIQIQMSVLFPNIFETKQYVTYPSNRCFLFTV